MPTGTREGSCAGRDWGRGRRKRSGSLVRRGRRSRLPAGRAAGGAGGGRADGRADRGAFWSYKGVIKAILEEL